MSKSFYQLFLAAVMSASMWFWVQEIAIPHQQAEAISRGTPRGNLSDLYPRWLGARELLLHHRDPYGADVTSEIQVGYYGRPLDSSRPNDPKDQQAFAYPLYVVFLLAPTVELPFPIVQRVFFWLLLALAAASVPLCFQALHWRPSRTTVGVWILLTLGCFPAIQGVKLQQLSLVVMALIAAAMALLARRYFVWAGIFLAVATIKPQLAALPILWLCIWVLGNWPERQRALWSFAITIGALVIAAEALLPGWIHEFRAALAAYYEYTGGGRSVLDVALTPTWGRILSVVLVVVLAGSTWQVRRSTEDSWEFQWSFSLSLAVTLAVIPMFAPYNQLLLVPALMVIVRSLGDSWRKSSLSRFMVVITAVAVFFPWVAAFLLVTALLFLPRPVVQQAWMLPFYPTFAIPITVLALLLSVRSVLQIQPAEDSRGTLPSA